MLGVVGAVSEIFYLIVFHHLHVVCHCRWKDVTLFLSGLQNEGIADTMYALLVYLHSSPKEQRPLVAVLLLHLDLLVCSYNSQFTEFLNYDLGSLCLVYFLDSNLKTLT